MILVIKAELADLPLLNTISFASKSHWNYPKEWMEQWRSGLMINANDFAAHHIYKIQEEATIFGFCLIQESAAHYEVEHLWILPAYIGKGYGKTLLEESLKATIKEQKPILVESDPNAEAFYARQGFVTYDQKESYPKGRFLPLMKRD